MSDIIIGDRSKIRKLDMGIDALITAAVIALLETKVEATLDELVNYASSSVGKKVTKKSVLRAIDRNRHRLEVEIDAGVLKVSLRL